MRAKVSKWFEIKVCYDKVMEDGLEKKVTETYVVEAMSFTEAEARITAEVGNYVSGEFAVQNISPVKYQEVWFSEEGVCECYFKAKLLFITIDERTEKERKQPIVYLVQASSFDECKNNIREIMGRTMIDYQISSVSETKIMDVFEV